MTKIEFMKPRKLKRTGITGLIEISCRDISSESGYLFSILILKISAGMFLNRIVRCCLHHNTQILQAKNAVRIFQGVAFSVFV